MKSWFQEKIERLHFHVRRISQHPFVVDNISRGKNHLLILSTRIKSAVPTKQQARDFWKEHHHRMVYLAIFFIACSIIIHLHAQAEVGSVDLYPTNCSGVWQHPEHMTGISDVTGDNFNFTLDNSAVPINNPSHVDCTAFNGNVPTGVVPKKFVVHLSWIATAQPLQGSITGSVVNDVSTSTSVIATSTDTVQSTATDTIQNSANTTATSDLQSTNLVKDDAISAPMLDLVPDATSEQGNVTTSTTNTITPPVDIPPIVTSTEPVINTDTATSQDTTVTTASSQDIIQNLDTSSSTNTQISTTTTNVATSSDSGVTQTTIIPQQQSGVEMTTNLPGQDFLGLEYTLDGVNWQKLGSINSLNYKNVSFEINNPDLAKWENLSNLQIRVETLLPDEELPNIYVDSVYLEADYEDIPKIIDPPKIVLKDSSVVMDGKPDFGSDETPTFVVTDPGLTTSDIQTLVDDNKAEVVDDPRGMIDVSTSSDATTSATSTNFDIQKNVIDPVINNVEQGISNTTNTVTSFLTPAVVEAAGNSATITDAQVLDANGEVTDIPVVISDVVVGGIDKQQVTITKPSRAFRPGKYTLKILLNTAQAIIVSQQDFTWGVLTINTDKSMYTPGDVAFLQMGVINDLGHTLCDADLSLVITSPSGSTYPFTTDNNSIQRSNQCAGDTYITVPDYSAYFTIPKEEGVYKMNLTAVTANGTRSIVSNFSVNNSPMFDVVRVGPTRIFPVDPYLVSLKITSPVDWSGIVTEKVPASFDITQTNFPDQYTDVSVSPDGADKIISWDVSLSAGEQKTIGYYFKAPEISPEFYLLGPLSFSTNTGEKIFQESRQWQIADDATCTSTTTAGTYNWNTGANWSGCSGAGGIPGTGDNITIATSVTMIMNANSNVLGTITVNGTLYTSDGTARSLSGTTITIGSAGTLASTQSNGTAAASTITLSGTTGTLMALTSGGVFTGSTGTVTLTGASATVTLNSGAFTGSNALNNLTLNSATLTATLGANITIGVAGTLTITAGVLNTSASGNYSITAGHIASASAAGAQLLINASTVTLNGTSGTLLSLGASSTFTAGTNSTIVFNADAAVTAITQNAVLSTFYNLTFSPVLTTNRTYTIGSTTNTIAINGTLSINPSGSGVLTVSEGAVLSVASTATLNITGSGGSATSVFDTSVANRAITAGNLNVQSAGTLIGGAANVITISGTGTNVFQMTGTFTPNTSTVTFTGGQTAGSGGANIPAITYYNLTLNNSADTYYLTGTTTVNTAGTLTITNGTLNTLSGGKSWSLNTGKISIANVATAIFTANASTITLTATSGTLFTLVGVSSVFNAGTSTVIVNSDASITFTAGVALTFYNLTFSPVLTTNRAYTLKTGAVLITVSGNLNIIPSGSGQLNITYTVVGGITIASGKTFLMQPSGSATAIFNPTAAEPISAGIIDIESGGTLSPAGASEVVTLTGATSTPLIVNGTGVFTPNTSTITFTGGQTAGGGGTNIPAIAYYGLTLNNSADTYYLTGTTTLSALGTLTVTAGTLDTSSTNNYPLSVGHITTAASASSIINANASTITFTAVSGTLFTIGAASVFNYGTSTLKAVGNGTLIFMSVATNTNPAYNVVFAPTLVSGTNITYSYEATAGSIYNIKGSFTVNPSEVDSGTSTLTVTGNSTLTVNGNMLVEASGTASSQYNVGYATTLGTLDIESGGTYNASSLTTTLNGTSDTPFTVNNGTFTKGTSTITFSGTHATTNIQIPGYSFYNLTLNKTGETFVLNSNNTAIDPNGTLTVTLGTLDTNSSNNYSLSVGKISIAASQAINANASTITLTGITGILMTKAGTFNYGTSTLVVANASGVVTLMSGSGLTAYNLTINSYGPLVNSSTNLTVNNNFHIIHGAYNQYAASTIGLTGNTTGTFVLDAGTTFCLGGGTGATIATCDNGVSYTGNIPFPANYTAAHVSLDPTSTFIYNSNVSITVNSFVTYGNLSIRPVLTATNTVTFGSNLNVAGNLDINPAGVGGITASVGSGGLTVSGTTTVESAGTGNATLDPTASNYPITTGSLIISLGDILLGRAATITISGNWTNNGTFTQNTSNVILNSNTTSVMTGTTTFYKLSITPASGVKEVDFATSSTPIFSVTNVFTATGHSGALVKLRSVSAGTQWKFNPTGTASVSFVDVKDGGCQGGAITMITTTSLNNGNNDTCWGFVPYLTFNISSSTVGFGNLSPYATSYATTDGTGSSTDVEGNNITVVSYAIGGYSLTVQGSSLSYGSHIISPIGNSNLAPSIGFEQFGIRAIATGGSGVVQAPYSGSGFGLPTNTNTVPSVIASESVGDGVSTTYSMHYVANAASNTPAGKYTTTLTYILTGTF